MASSQSNSSGDEDNPQKSTEHSEKEVHPTSNSSGAGEKKGDSSQKPRETSTKARASGSGDSAARKRWKSLKVSVQKRRGGAQEGNSSSPKEQLLDAVERNDLNRFQHLLDRHKFPTKLLAVCLERASSLVDGGEMVRILLEIPIMRPNLNVVKPEPIHYAAKAGSYQALSHLLRHKKIEVNAVDSKGDTALHYLAIFFKKEDAWRFERCITMLLTRQDVDINKTNKRGFTPIHQAAHSGCTEMVELVLEHRPSDVDLDGSNALGRTARSYITQEYPHLCHKLPPIKYNSAPGYENQILVAFQNRHLEVFDGLLRQVDKYGNPLFDPNFSYERPYCSTCLEMACRQHGYHEFLKLLLYAGADPNKVNKVSFKTPIHIAAEALNHEAIQVLIEEGANTNAVDRQGWTALHYAIASPEAQLENEYMSEDDTEINCLISKLNESSGARKKRMRMLENLEKCIRTLNDHITFPLQIKEFVEFANDRGNRKAVEILSQLKEMSVTRPRHSPTRIDIPAILFDLLNKNLAQDFIEKFEDAVKTVDNLSACQDSSGNTFLQVAVESGLEDVVKCLLEHGTDPNVTTEWNRSPPLVTATKKQNVAILSLLLDDPLVDVNVVDKRGDTALHHAFRTENLRCCILLLNKGARVDLPNNLRSLPVSLKSLTALLDQSLSTNREYFPHEDDHEIVFDYSLLTATGPRFPTPNCKTTSTAINISSADDALKPETNLVYFLSREDLKYEDIFEHPIVWSFLRVKWDNIKGIFYVNVFVYLMYFLFLNASIIFNPDCSKCNSNNSTTSASSSCTSEEFDGFLVVTIIFTVLLSLREVAESLLFPKTYLKYIENYLDVITFALTWALLFPLGCGLRSTMNVITILVSSFKLMLLIGRCPTFSRNIEMLVQFSSCYFVFFCSYIFIILAFSHCLYIVLGDSIQLRGVSVALSVLFRTFIFMTGEYDAKDLQFNGSPWMSVTVFILFVFIISIVLGNLLISLSVNDTKDLEDRAKLSGMMARISVIHSLEIPALEALRFQKKYLPNSHFLGRCLDYILSGTRRFDNKASLFPNQGNMLYLGENGPAVQMNKSVLRETLRIIERSTEVSFHR